MGGASLAAAMVDGVGGCATSYGPIKLLQMVLVPSSLFKQFVVVPKPDPLLNKAGKTLLRNAGQTLLSEAGQTLLRNHVQP